MALQWAAALSSPTLLTASIQRLDLSRKLTYLPLQGPEGYPPSSISPPCMEPGPRRTSRRLGFGLPGGRHTFGLVAAAPADKRGPIWGSESIRSLQSEGLHTCSLHASIHRCALSVCVCGSIGLYTAPGSICRYVTSGNLCNLSHLFSSICNIRKARFTSCCSSGQ